MDTNIVRRAVSLALAAGLALTVAACGGDASDSEAEDGVITITVNGMPPETDAVNRRNFEADVAAFEAANPDIKIDAKEGYMDTQTFSAKLAGGQLEDVFYVYFTDPATLIAKNQVSEISDYLDEYSVLDDVRPELMEIFQDSDGNSYGLPCNNYTLGLVYNRDLFTQAGLDPDNPPTTWEQVREYAKQISALGDDIVGYGDYSKSNTGGWHYTAELYSLGGSIATEEDGGWTASFNDDLGRQVLQQLYDMRWTDNSMGENQLLEYADLLTLMAAGKLGMYIGSSDNLTAIVNQYEGTYDNLGLGAIPGGEATLGGGDGYMFKAGLSEAKIEAGLKWIMFKELDPDRIESDNAQAAEDGSPVGLPEPNIWTGESAAKQDEATAKYANIPTENYQAFVANSSDIPLKLEPPNAQQVYAVLDTVMASVLTDENADVDALLDDAESQVNTILATVE